MPDPSPDPQVLTITISVVHSPGETNLDEIEARIRTRAETIEAAVIEVTERLLRGIPVDHACSLVTAEKRGS